MSVWMVRRKIFLHLLKIKLWFLHRPASSLVYILTELPLNYDKKFWHERDKQQALARERFHLSRKIEWKRKFRRHRKILQQSILGVQIVRQDWLQEVEDRVWWQELYNVVQSLLSSIKSGEFLYQASNHQLVRKPVVHIINTVTVIRQPWKEGARIDPHNISLSIKLLWISL